MIRVLWMPAFAGMTMLSTSSLATVDETPAYIHALATYAESKVINDAGLERIIEGCSAGQIANPLTREVARTSTDKLLAFETLQDYINNAELDSNRVCAWAKKAQDVSRRQQEERETTCQHTTEVYEAAPSLLSASYSYTYAIDSNGKLRCWSSFEDCEAKTPSYLSDIRSISASSSHLCSIDKNGEAWCWDGSSPEVQVPFDLGPVRSISAGYKYTCAVKMDNSVRCWGWIHNMIIPEVPADLGPVWSVSAGHGHACAVQLDGQARCWGENQFKESTVPSYLGGIRSVSAGSYYTCVVMADGSVQCWGRNDDGETDVPFDLGKVRSISSGIGHACAVKMNGTVHCWGKNGNGQSSVPLDLGKVHSVSAGLDYTCAVKENGAVGCWPYSEVGWVYSITYSHAKVPDGLCLLGFECKDSVPSRSLFERLVSWWNS